MSFSKKILFISTNEWVPFGGSEVLWSNTALKLSEKNIQCFFSVKKFNTLPPEINKLTMTGLEGYFRENPRIKKLSLRLFNRIAPAKLQVKPQREIFNYILKLKPDLTVLNIGDQTCLFAIEYAEFLQKYNLDYCNIIQLVDPYRYFYDSIFEGGISLYASAKINFFVSHQNKELVERLLARKLNNSMIIPNPFNFHQTDIPPYPDNGDGFNLALVARLEPVHKGHDILLETLSMEKWKKRQLRVNLYGDGNGSLYLKKLKQHLELEQITFHGHVKDKSEIWANNHCLIAPSRMEGQSLTLLEAMSYERMVIASDVGDARQFIRDGRNGFLIPYPYPFFIDETLERAWAKREEWKGMGKESSRILKENITEDPIEILSKELIQLLKQ